MKKGIFIAIFVSFLGAQEALAQTQASAGSWIAKTVSYAWPGLEGLEQHVELGFFVTQQNQVLRQAVYHEGHLVAPDPLTGIVTYAEEWIPRQFHFTIQIQFRANYYQITSSLNGTDKSKVYSGFLALTEEEILAEIISISKNDEARSVNVQSNVNDMDISRAILFAAKSYDIPILIFTALIYLESKFNVGDKSGDIQGLAQVSERFSVEQCERDYFKSDDFKVRVQKDSTIRPNREEWNSIQNNLLYGAAYLRYLYLQSIDRLPGVADEERWKFVLVFYNLGIEKACAVWELAKEPTQWNSTFASLLSSGEKRNYAPSVYFYASRLSAGERNLRQYDAGQDHADIRSHYIQTFNQ